MATVLFPAAATRVFKCEPPAKGVQIGWAQAGGVVPLVAAHDGASGPIAGAVLVPVVREGDRHLVVKQGGSRAEPNTALIRESALLRIRTRKEVDEQPQGMELAVPANAWLDGADGLLVLLLFKQSRHVGGGSFDVLRSLQLHLHLFRLDGLSGQLREMFDSQGQVVVPAASDAPATPDAPAPAPDAPEQAGLNDVRRAVQLGQDIGALPAGAADGLVAALCSAIEDAFADRSANALGMAVVPRPAGLGAPTSAVAMRSVVETSLKALPMATAPAEPAEPVASTATTFAIASCQYPAGMLDGVPAAAPRAASAPADASYLRLVALLDRPDGADGSPPKPAFLLLMGDQVYVDATAGLFDPTVADDRYRIAHDNFLASRGAYLVRQRLPIEMLLDDHEIEDNWEPAPGAPGTDPCNEARLRDGRAAFLREQRPFGSAGRPGGRPDVLWRHDTLAGLPFFLADTRTDRTPRTAACLDEARIMRPAQARALLRWLLRRKRAGGPCFVASGAMLLPRLLSSRQPGGALRSDGWDGYPASLHGLLAFVLEHRIDNVVFLSGDAHLSCVAEIVLTEHDRATGAPIGKPLMVHSVHSSALYAPFPFANARPEDYARRESFDFTGPRCAAGHTYRCSVRTWFAPPGDGFALVSVTRAPASWQWDVTFDRQPGSWRWDVTRDR